MVKVHNSEDVANHAGPESCGAHREVCTEALAGDTGRLAIEPRNQKWATRLDTHQFIAEASINGGCPT